MSKIPIPKILECSRLIAKSNSTSKRIVKDYELDFYVNGKRQMVLDDKEYQITMGTVVYRKPGQIVESRGDYNCYIMTLDLSNSMDISTNQYMRTHNNDFQKETQHILLDEFPAVFVTKHYDCVWDLYEKININTYPFPENNKLSSAYLKELLLLLASDVSSLQLEKKQKSSKESYIDQAYEFINKNYHTHILIKNLAKQISVNQNYLIRIFKEKANTTPNQYLNEVRLFHARQMLIESSLPITSIALKCGFNTPAYFSECFKRKFSCTPLEFRNQK